MRSLPPIRNPIQTLSILLLSTLLLVAPAGAATFLANSTVDGVDVNPGDGICANAGSNCSLRAAVMEANALPGADTIELLEGTYSLTIPSASSDIDASVGDLDIGGGTFGGGNQLTIQGIGASKTLITTNQANRLFEVPVDLACFAFQGCDTLTLRNLDLRSGNTTGLGVFDRGAAISASSRFANVFLEDVRVAQNSGNSVVFSQANLTVTRTEILANTGSGIRFQRDTAARDLTIIDSTIENNSGTGSSGVSIEEADDVELTNVTITGNRLHGYFQQLGTARLNNVTISGNQTGNGIAGIGILFFPGPFLVGPDIEVVNSIVTGHGAGDILSPGQDANAVLPTSLGYNLIGDGGSGAFGATGDATNADAALEFLADNGGPVRTQALGPGSQAVDTGNPAVPGTGGTSCAATDARGESRPFDGDDDGTPRCDKGAFEAQEVLVELVELTLTKDDDVDPVQAGGTLVYTLTVTNPATSTGDANNVTVTETYDPNVSFVSAVPAPTAGNDTWNVGTLTPGQSTNILVTVAVASPLPDGTLLANAAEAVADEVTTPVPADEQTEVGSNTLLSGTKTDSPDPVAAGAPLTYEIMVGNDAAANETLTNVTLVETYDPNVIFVSAVPPPDVGDDQWNLGDLAPGDSQTISITVQVASPLPDGTNLFNSAIVSGDQDGGQVTETTVVDSSTQLALTKTDSVDPVLPGAQLVYTLDWANDPGANQVATNATVLESYPAGVSFVSAVPPPDTGDNEWDLGNLAPGDSGTIEITVQVNAGAGSVLDNQAMLVSDQETVNAGEATFVGIPVPPTVDLKLNGVDGTTYASGQTSVPLGLSLDPGTFAGQPGDWLIGFFGPFGSVGILLFQPLPLVEFTDLTLPLPPLVTPGSYTFFFAVDTSPNGAFQDNVAVDLGEVIVF